MAEIEEVEPQITEDIPVTHTGTVVARYIVGVVDGPDEGDEPDIIPAQGTFEFVPSVGYVPNPLANHPYTMIKDTFYGVLDDEGFLCTPISPNDLTTPGRRGVKLLANNAPGASVENWTWKVTPKFVGTSGRRGSNIIPPFNITVLAGEEVDLTTVQKVPASPGLGVEQAVALVISANNSVTMAERHAAAAEEAAKTASQQDIIPDPEYAGLFLIRNNRQITPDPENPGLFLLGA